MKPECRSAHLSFAPPSDIPRTQSGSRLGGGQPGKFHALLLSPWTWSRACLWCSYLLAEVGLLKDTQDSVFYKVPVSHQERGHCSRVPTCCLRLQGPHPRPMHALRQGHSFLLDLWIVECQVQEERGFLFFFSLFGPACLWLCPSACAIFLFLLGKHSPSSAKLSGSSSQAELPSIGSRGLILSITHLTTSYPAVGNF